jgi:predicted N-acetyltransferase YhbS
MNLKFRLEEQKDHFEVECMTREAFWDIYKPGCNEHFLVHQLRKSNAFVPELDYVAYDGEILVGNIIYSSATIVDGNSRVTVLCMGPFCVAPSYQKKGIGSALLKKTIEIAGKMEFKGVVIFGNPEYYQKFGFKNAKEYGIQTSEGENFDAFMVLELGRNTLQGVGGRFFGDEAFNMDPVAFDEYDKKFPKKEKHKLPGQIFG